jgi:gliding motility-associated protein GldL
MSKEITGFRPGSKKWKAFMAKLYGLGGAVVILGALFKIQHYPGADIMLILGLGTETIIFIFSAFEPLHEDPDWSLVYPELAEDYDGEGASHGGGHGGGSSLSATQELDLMLEQAKIGPELIESLGKGMQNLSETAANMNNLGNVAGATNEFVDNVKSASVKVGDLSESYKNAAEALTGLSVSNADGATYAENLKKVNDNLEALNNVYEMQIREGSNSTQLSSQMYTNIQQMIDNLNASVEDTKRYKENIAELSNNLQSLNTIYGNMLSAMNYNRPQA